MTISSRDLITGITLLVLIIGLLDAIVPRVTYYKSSTIVKDYLFNGTTSCDCVSTRIILY